ncbi:MAG TPA: SBBP repeat-containing protein [Methylomirabilota bacterium]
MQQLQVFIVVMAFIAGVFVPSSVGAAEVDRTVPGAPGVPPARAVTALRTRVAFEMNQGQTDEEVRFIARANAYTLFLTPTDAVMTLRNRGEDRAVVRMKLVGANQAPRIAGVGELAGKANYFKRGPAATRITGVPIFAAVKYTDVYPGIDLVYHGRQDEVEYDFVLAPGADPAAIALAFDGADRLDVSADGDLVVHTAAGELRQLRPVVYQEVEGVRRDVTGRYVLKGAREVGIRVGTHDQAQALVIDPVLVYSTYLGGSGDDGALRIAVDGAGNAYVTGTTSSVDFPTTAGADRTLGGNQDAFVAKFSPTGALVYSTYLGGPCDDEGRGIAVDGGGNAYITGRIGLCFGSSDPAGVLVAKLNPAGALVYSFTFGGSLGDSSRGQGIAVDSAGNAYVTGLAQAGSHDFPTTAGAYRTTDCNGFLADGFAAKINPGGTGFVYSTFLCGTAHESPNAIAIDAAGNAYVAGSTESHDFPVVNAFQPAHHGGPAGTTGFVAKLDPTGSSLIYSTYLGGTFDDHVNGIAVDSQGNAYVTGDTSGGDFPTTAGVVQPNAPFPICFGQICVDAFVAKFTPTGSLVYSTYLAGGLDDSGEAIAVDGAGNVYVAGSTTSLDFPIRDAFQTQNRGLSDAFITKLNPDATRILYSSYLGGGKRDGSNANTEGTDGAGGIAVDSAGNVHMSGVTSSFDFPTTAGAFQRNFGGGTCFLSEPCNDAFVARITAGGPGVIPPIHLEVTPTEVPPGGMITASWGGIPTPTTRDVLELFPLGERSDSTNVKATYATTGGATGALALTLPGTLNSGSYELRLLTPDPNSSELLHVVARSEPIYVSVVGLTSIVPGQGTQGTSVPVTINGGGFVTGATVSFDVGIAVSNVTVRLASQITASLTISATAAVGPRAVTVTNPVGGGATLPAGFTVNAAVVVTPPSLSLTYNGKVRDRVGQDNLALGADGVLDGTLTATLAGGARTITRLDLRSSTGGIWETDGAVVNWALGMAATLDGPLLNNPSTIAVNAPVADGGSFVVFAADFQNALFVPGTTLTLTATFADGSTASASTTVSGAVGTPTLNVVDNGKVRDRVGQDNLALGADGVLDGTLTATLGGGARTITRLDLRSSTGGIWETDGTVVNWALGMAATLDGPLLNNPSTMAVNAPVADGGSFVVFAADFQNALFVPGTTLTLTATFADGSTASANATVPAGAPAALSLVYNGMVRDRVGQDNLALGPDGAPDATLTARLAGGARTITRLDLRSSTGGIWETDGTVVNWALGMAATLDGPLLNNPSTMAVNVPVADGATFVVFAADFQNALFQPGTTLTLTATFADGSTVVGVAMVP